MKARLLFSFLLCLFAIELSAQDVFNDWLKHHKANRKEQVVKSRVNQGFTKSDAGTLKGISTRSISNDKYYPPKVNREYTYYNSDGTVSGRGLRYFEFDSWGNILLEENDGDYREVYTYSEITHGKLKLSETAYRWNGIEWVESLDNSSFTTLLNGEGIRTGINSRIVKEATFNEKGYLTWIYEAYGSEDDRAKVKISWKDDFPSEFYLVSYGDSLALKNIVPMYEIEKLNPYLCFSDDWDEYLFDSEGDNLSLFNADIVIGSEANEDGTVVLMEGHVVSTYDAEKNQYTRTIKVSTGGLGFEVPMLVETKTYLDGNGSFSYTYANVLDDGTYTTTKIFNEKGDIIKYEAKEINGEYVSLAIYTYDRTYDENGLPLKTIAERRDDKGVLLQSYVETYGEKIVPDTSLEIEVTKPGTLRETVYALSVEHNKTTKLTVSGPLNEEDLRFIRDELWQLETLNLKHADLEYVPSGLFTKNDRLASVILPEGLKCIFEEAFAYCFNLQEVELPSSLNYIADNAFTECSQLGKLICHMPAPLNIGVDRDPFRGIDKKKCQLRVPAFSANIYNEHSYWREFVTQDPMDEAMPASLILNGSVRVDKNWLSPVSDLALGYGSGLTVDGEGGFALNSLIMQQGDNKMQEWFYNSYGYRIPGRILTPSAIVTNCEGTITDKVEIKYACRSGSWYFLSFPFDVNRADITVEKLDTTEVGVADYVFRYYDGAQRAQNGTGQSWKDVTGEILSAGQGYIFQANREVCLTVRGNAENGNRMLSPIVREIPVSENISDYPYNQGWNLIGNPYPCYYNMSGMDFKAPITVWNKDSYTYDAYSVLDADEYVFAPMEAFFVQVPLGTSAIRFIPEQRFAENPSMEGKSKVRSMNVSGTRSLVNLRLSDGVYADKTRIAFDVEASADYDMQEDAAKFMSPVTMIPQLYTLNNAHLQYAINARPLVEGETVRLGYYAGKAGEYTLCADKADVNVWLYDALTGNTVELSSEGYRFVSETGSFEDRFVLSFGIRPTSVKAEINTTCEVLSVEGGILVKGQIGEKVEVYTVAGVKVAELPIEEMGTFISLTKGAYVVKAGKSICKSVVY